jgi:hypothetical protein
MTTAWMIAIDWDRDGTFSSQYDDMIGDTLSAQWFLGRIPLGSDRVIRQVGGQNPSWQTISRSRAAGGFLFVG